MDLLQFLKNTTERTIALKMPILADELRTSVDGYRSDEEISQKIDSFHKNLKKKMYLNHNSFEKVLNSPWCVGTLEFLRETAPTESITPKGKVGRPSKEFSDLSQSGKRKRTSSIRMENDLEQLQSATASSMRSFGKRALASRLDHIEDPEEEVLQKFKPLTLEEGISILVFCGMSKAGYNFLSQLRPGFFPCYSRVSEAKKDCYPMNIAVSDTECDVPVKDLLQHTSQRLFDSLGSTYSDQLEDQQEVIMDVKWGMDGTSGMPNHKQGGSTDSEGEVVGSDSSVFVTSLVPLRVSYQQDTI